MAQRIDLSELKALLAQFITVSISNGDGVFHLIICVECDHVVGRAELGESYNNVAFEAMYEHDCEDKMEDTAVLDPDPTEYTEPADEDSEPIEPLPGIGPIRNESPLPEPTPRLMAGLMAEIAFDLSHLPTRGQDEKGEAA